MKRSKLLRPIGAALLAAAMTFTGTLASVPVYAADISENELPEINEEELFEEDDVCLSAENEGELFTEAIPVSSGKVLRLGTSGIKNGQHIYFGTAEDDSTIYKNGTTGNTYPYWRVLDIDKANNGNDTGMFLLSEYLWAGADGEGIAYNNSVDPNVGQSLACNWDKSDAQAWCRDRFLTRRFTAGETASVMEITLVEDEWYNPTWMRGCYSWLNADTVFFPSGKEIWDYLVIDKTANHDAGYSAYYCGSKVESPTGYPWWLRTKSSSSTNTKFALWCGGGTSYGTDWCVQTREVNEPIWGGKNFYARPAFNINKNKVLLSSAAKDGKPIDGWNLKKVSSSDVKDWKLTLIDDRRSGFNVSGSKDRHVKPGEEISISYYGATTGSTKERVAVLLVNTSNDILYYGNINQTSHSDSGTKSITVPSELLPGQYTLKVFSEQHNPDYETDLASTPVDIKLTIDSDWTVSFDNKGHGTKPADQGLCTGQKATKPAMAASDGIYKFEGWFTDAACTKAYDFNSAVSGNLKLYAKWTAYYVVSFNMNGHGTAPSAQNIVGGSKAAKPKDPTESGLSFGGWYKDGACIDAFDFNTAITKDTTLYAKWTKAASSGDPSKPSDPGSSEKPKDPEQVNNFVERMYQNVLKRPSEAKGKAYWSDQLLSGKNCGSTLAQGFVCSPEFTNQNVSDEEFVDTLYHTFFDRDPDPEGKANWLKALSEGATRTQVLAGFVNSLEFANLCDKFGIARGTMLDDGSTLYNEGVRNFVLRNYTETLGREGETTGVEDWSARIIKGELTMKDVAIEFLHSQEFLNKNLNDEDYVKVLYRTFMGREYDEGGLKYWLGEIATRGRDDIVNGFADSQEFADIMAKYQ